MTASLALAVLALAVVLARAFATVLGLARGGSRSASGAGALLLGGQSGRRVGGGGDARRHPVSRAGKSIDLDEHGGLPTRVRGPEGLRGRPWLDVQVALRR